MDRRIVAFAGRARSGKSLCSKILKEKRGGTILTVASYLKKLCLSLMRLSMGEHLTFEEMDAYKNNGTILNIVPTSEWAKTISKETGLNADIIEKEIAKYPVIKNVRELLQVIGTDIIRQYYPDWHIDCLISELHTLPEDTLVLVDDVRFPNELEKLEKEGAEVFFVLRPETFNLSSNHASEVSLTWKMMSDEDHIIVNLPSISINRIENDLLWYYDHIIANKDFVSDRDTVIFASDHTWGLDAWKGCYNIDDFDGNKTVISEVVNRPETKILTDKNRYPTLRFHLSSEKEEFKRFFGAMLKWEINYELADDEEVGDPFMAETLKLFVKN